MKDNVSKDRPPRIPDPSPVHGMVIDEEVNPEIKEKLPITWQETDYFEYNRLGGPLSEEFTREN